MLRNSIIFTIALVLSLSGCKTLDRLKQTTGQIDNTVSDISNTVSTISGDSNDSDFESSNPNQNRYQEAVSSEEIKIHKPTRTQRNYGDISVTKTEQNPKGQTKVTIDSCIHPKIGSVRCGGYLYEVTENGWLSDDLITFNDLNYPTITLAAGTYYVKFHNWEGNKKYYSTGQITIEPFVTNFVRFSFE